MAENVNKTKAGIIIITIALLFLCSAMTIWFMYNEEISAEPDNKSNIKSNIKSDINTIPRLENPTTMGSERYKILGMVIIPNENKNNEFEIGIVIHLDDGRLRLVPVKQAARDNDLLNINEGYLYRTNGQFYFKKN